MSLKKSSQHAQQEIEGSSNSQEFVRKSISE